MPRLGDVANVAKFAVDLFGGGGDDAEAAMRRQQQADYTNYYRNLRAAQAAAREQMTFQRRENAKERAFQLQNWRRNAALQERFSRMGIRWKTADAKAAGLHPVYGAGLPGSSASPIHIGGTSVTPPGGGYVESPYSRVPRSFPRTFPDLPAMGQDVSGPVQATLSPVEQAVAHANLELLKAGAQKDYAIATYYASRAGRNTVRTTQQAKPVPTPPADGSRKNPYSLWNYFVDENGNIVRAPHSQFAEGVEGVLPSAMAVDANPEAIERYRKRAYKELRPQFFKDWRKGWRKRLKSWGSHTGNPLAW